MKASRPHAVVSVITNALVAVLLSAGMSVGRAVAQEGPQPILNSQFSFSSPGARSLGLGGAFVALADDATAAWANPAGLVQIAKPEVSVEGRHWRYSSPFLVSGRVSGTPTGVGLDTMAGLRAVSSESTATGLAFLSFVYPQDRWSVAIYRHVLANLEAQGETQGLFGSGTDCCDFRYLDQRTRSVLDIVSYGLSAAYRITDTFSLGFGFAYYDTDFEIQSDLYFWDDLEDPFGGVTSYLPERFVLGQTVFGDGSSIDLSGGFLWKINRHWSLGGRYRQGPVVEMSGVSRVGSVIDLGVPPGSVIELDLTEEAKFPDNYGLGIAYRSDDGRLTLGFEWDRVTYSETLQSIEVDDQEIDDADELHLGGEWAFLQSEPLLALRAGIWHDPAHQTRANDRADDFTRALMQPREDELHFALGLGAAFESFQIDGAVDISDSVKTLSLSAIYSF